MTIVADALNGRELLLLPQRDRPYFVRAVYERVIDGCRNELLLEFGDCRLLVQANENFDSLSAEFLQTKFEPGSSHRNLTCVAPWDRLVGKECSWTWIGINQQGYSDSMMISFDGIIPSILLQVIASSIDVFSIVPVNDASKLP